MIFNRYICIYNITSQVLPTAEFLDYNDVKVTTPTKVFFILNLSYSYDRVLKIKTKSLEENMNSKRRTKN